MGIYRLSNRVVTGAQRTLETARPRAARDARARRFHRNARARRLQKIAVLLACIVPFDFRRS